MKKSLILTLIMSMVFTIVGNSSIEAKQVSYTENNIIEENEIMPTAISGTKTVRGTQGQFSIYSPGWSKFGHIEVTISNATEPVFLQMTDPNGRKRTDPAGKGYVVCNPNTTTKFNITDAPAGTYIFEYLATGQYDTPTITVKLCDWWS